LRGALLFTGLASWLSSWYPNDLVEPATVAAISGQPDARRDRAAGCPQRVITLEIDGVPVIITVEHETSETLAAQGFPAERAVYVTSWDAGQIDDTRTFRT